MVAVCWLAGATYWTQAQTANSPASYFVFPRFVAFGDISTGIAIVNPNLSDASAVLALKDSEGVDVGNPVAVAVPARGQVALTAEQLFDSGSVINASLVVSSDSPGLIVRFQTFDYSGNFTDGSDAPLAGTELVFPVVPRSDEGVAELTLLNPNPRPTAVELKLWNSSGAMLGKTTVQVPAGGFYRNLSGDIFQSADFSAASHVTATSKPLNVFSRAQSIMGTSLFLGFSSAPSDRGAVDLASLNAISPVQGVNVSVIPAFHLGKDASGAEHAATLSLVNIEAAPVQVQVSFVAKTGSILGAATLELAANGGGRAPLQSLAAGLASRESEGWILIQATGRVYGAVIQGRSEKPALTAIPPQRAPQFAFLFPQLVQDAAHYTEVSLTNPNSVNSEIDLFVIAPDGASIASRHATIGPNSQLCADLAELLPEIENQAGGIVYVRSDLPLFGNLSIGQHEGRLLTAFAPADAPPNYSPAPLSTFAVTGQVTLNYKPAPGFRVVLSGPVSKIATSDQDGRYVITGMTPGRYSMTVDQYGFEFLPAQLNFDTSSGSRRQDFQAFTAPGAILVQPSALPVRSPDTRVTIFGRDLNATSQAYAGLVRLHTTVLSDTELQVLVPSFMTAAAEQYEIYVVSNDGTPERRVSQSYPLIVFQDRPALASIDTGDYLVAGASGATLTLRGAGFLKGAQVKVNGSGEDIRTEVLDDTQILAYLSATRLASGGIFPVTVQNPYPANTESNIQLLTVFYPAPAVQSIAPGAVIARLEPGAGPMSLEVAGFGFRRGAVVLFDSEPLITTHCEADPHCLGTRLSAVVPAHLLRSSGFAQISVRNPNPSLGASESVFLRIDGLRPTIAAAVPGTATALASGSDFTIPVVVHGTNFGVQTQIRIYRANAEGLPEFEAPAQLLSSTQLYAMLETEGSPIGEWMVELENPQPGGGRSEPVRFVISEANFVASPFLISLTPDVVAAGSPELELTINGTNFVDGAQVLFYSTYVPAVVISPRQLRATIPAALVAAGGRFPIAVTNPDGGGTSNRLYIDVR
jgi:hypothetical protein